MMTHPIVQEDLERIVALLRDEASALEGKTILVSGGSGFLGRYLLATLDRLNKTVFSRPCFVISIDNFITASRTASTDHLDPKQFRLIEADIRTPLTIDEPVHFIIHAAGLASPTYYKKFPLETIESTFVGAKNLLELARAKQVESFLFFSSSEIYGDPDAANIPTTEAYRGNVACIGPRACYDESKRLTETLCSTYAEQHAVPVKIVRPFNVYGPGMGPTDYRVIPAFFAAGLSGNALPVHSNGVQTRSFCYISDAIVGYFKTILSTHQGEAFNIGNPDLEISMGELAEKIAPLIGPEVRVNNIEYPDTYPAGEPVRRRPDITKARTLLRFEPQVGLEEGLARSLRWFKDVYFSGSEQV